MKYIARLAVLGLSVLSLGGVAVYAAANPGVITQAQVMISSIPSDITGPAPSPSPSPVVVVPQDVTPPSPTDNPLPSPIPSPIPTPQPAAFPVVQPTAVTIVNPGQPQQTTVPVEVPQTMVFIGATCDQPCSDPNTGGIKCTAPCTITFTADFQGGFAGITPTFVWSDGGTTQTHPVTYTQAGAPHVSVIAYETYNGITYKVGSANSIPITIL